MKWHQLTMFTSIAAVQSGLVVMAWFVDLWYRLLMLPGKEDKAEERTTEDVLEIDCRSIHTVLYFMTLTEAAGVYNKGQEWKKTLH